MTCNNGTRAADLAVGWFARLKPFDHHEENLHWKEVKSRESSLRQLAPGLIEEVFDKSPSSRRWIQSPNGVWQQVTAINANGPILAAHLLTFGAKMAMALFREHTGKPLPADGVAYVQPFLNGGIDQFGYDTAISILPGYNTLSQGKKEASSQFSYRFNTDERHIVGAMASLHNNMHFLVFAVAGMPEAAGVLRPRTAGAIQPGQLLEALHSPVPYVTASLQESASIADRPEAET